jgi:signal transduction histidine kinase
MSSRVFQLLEPLLRQKDLHWALHGREAAEARPVTVDPASFEQVLTNLVLNAIQACRHGGHIETHFEVIGRVAPKGVRADGTSWACLRIRDDGTGIPTEILPNIFEPFVTTKPLGEGTGLGLAVSFGIVRDHGGWIEARNTAPHGAEFSVFLPMSPTS